MGRTFKQTRNERLISGRTSKFFVFKNKQSLTPNRELGEVCDEGVQLEIGKPVNGRRSSASFVGLLSDGEGQFARPWRRDHQ